MATAEALGMLSSTQVPQDIFPERSILQLPNLVREVLSDDQRRVFNRIFTLSLTEAPMEYSSDEAPAYLNRRFGIPLEDLYLRRALTVEDLVLGAAALFSPLRAKRPIQLNSGDQIKVLQDKNLSANCDFCPENLENRTPKGSFGRIMSEHSYTAENPGPYMARHGLVIPRNIHDPLKLTEEVFIDMIQTGNEWLIENHRLNPEANYPIMIANILPRAGSSVFHPHLQVMLAEGRPLPKARDLRDRMGYYQFLNGYPYPDEVAYCLRPLGLVHDLGSAHAIFDLTPAKEKGVTIYANDGNPLPNGDLSAAIYAVIDWQRKVFNVTSFNMAIYMRPMELRSKQEADKWHNFFPYARTVDRGSEDVKTADMGAMETFFAPVVAADQVKLSVSFAEYLRQISKLAKAA